jgi:hypothetical protein
MRVSESFLRMVDDWRRSQTDVPSRAEAIGRMVELATKEKKKPATDRRAPNPHDEMLVGVDSSSRHKMHSSEFKGVAKRT